MKSYRSRICTALLLAVPVAATAHDYDYVDGGIVDGDAPRNGSDLGVRLSGSANVAEPVALFGEVLDTDTYSQFSGGAMFHTPLGEGSGVELNAGGSLELVDNAYDSDTGLGARAGLRWRIPQLQNRLELNPEIRHLYVFDTPSTSLRNNVLYRVASNLDLQGAIQIGDDDRAELGMRYNFSP